MSSVRWTAKQYKHINSGKLYWRLANVLLKPEMTECIAYCPCNDENDIYIMRKVAFGTWFEEVK